eukprot:318642-Rhodomonas_salina.2
MPNWTCAPADVNSAQVFFGVTVTAYSNFDVQVDRYRALHEVVDGVGGDGAAVEDAHAVRRLLLGHTCLRDTKKGHIHIRAAHAEMSYTTPHGWDANCTEIVFLSQSGSGCLRNAGHGAYTANSNTRNRTPGTRCTENAVSCIRFWGVPGRTSGPTNCARRRAPPAHRQAHTREREKQKQRQRQRQRQQQRQDRDRDR